MHSHFLPVIPHLSQCNDYSFKLLTLSQHPKTKGAKQCSLLHCLKTNAFKDLKFMDTSPCIHLQQNDVGYCKTRASFANI